MREKNQGRVGRAAPRSAAARTPAAPPPWKTCGLCLPPLWVGSLILGSEPLHGPVNYFPWLQTAPVGAREGCRNTGDEQSALCPCSWRSCSNPCRQAHSNHGLSSLSIEETGQKEENARFTHFAPFWWGPGVVTVYSQTQLAKGQDASLLF